jgi:hypothetical protein
MWTGLRYSILADDEWTSNVGPIGPGSTSLPKKTALWTTTRGKLTQDENNRLAREFKPAMWDLRHYDDDWWVKNHPGDPRAEELADYLDDLREKMADATAGMWKMMAGWSRDQMIDAGLLVYSGVAKDLAHFAGVYEQSDWFEVDDQCQRFKPLMNDEYGGMLIAETVGLLSMSSQHWSEHHMTKYTDARGEMWTGIPYSILADDEWTSNVGPIGPGSTSLPKKTGLWTTTRGKLTQEENNRLAREFRPAMWDLRHYDDDTWVKNHPGDPRAEELYRATQASSVVLRDKGSELLEDDIEKLRAGAGR